jgi:hypothetical protein
MRDARREAKDRTTLGGRRMALVILTLGLMTLPACSKNDNTTLVNTGLGCGLVRRELTGTWQVSFTTNSVVTANCAPVSFNGMPISVNSTSKNYSIDQAFGSDTAAAFQVTGDGSSSDPVNPELIGSVQADSCLALFRVWDSSDMAYIQCIGTFDRPSGTIAGSCDSADIDNPVGGSIEATCDLSSLILVSVAVF